MADPYKTLGVARDANEADIKKAYRKLAKELHPDRNKDNPKASEKFSQVTNAYDLLNDKDKRARFDRGEIDGDGNPAAPFGFGGGGGGRPQPGGGFRSEGYESGGPDMSDIFEGLFGGAQRGGGARAQRRDVERLLRAQHRAEQLELFGGGAGHDAYVGRVAAANGVDGLGRQRRGAGDRLERHAGAAQPHASAAAGGAREPLGADHPGCRADG